jgi:hypothetical protein
VRSEEATLAAREAARKRVALKQQAPSRVVNPEDFAEEALVKPSVGDVKAVKHGQGHYYMESPLDETAYWVDVDRSSKQPKWDVTKEGDEGARRSFPSLREAVEYARDDMARPLAKTEAERAALPPMERAEYEAQQAALTRSERSQRGARTAAINRRPGDDDIIKADEWYKATSHRLRPARATPTRSVDWVPTSSASSSRSRRRRSLLRSRPAPSPPRPGSWSVSRRR